MKFQEEELWLYGRAPCWGKGSRTVWGWPGPHPGSLQCCDAEVPGEEVMGALEM